MAMALNTKSGAEMLALAYKTNFIALLKTSDLMQDKSGNDESTMQRIERSYIDDGYHLGRTVDETDPTRMFYTTMDMDVAMHRPFLATCCKTDSTIRIWNYVTMECEMVKCLTLQKTGQAPEPVRPLSVSFHPSGYLLAGGFESQAIIWHVLLDELRQFCVFPHYKHCTKVRFSHGGQMLAIAQMYSIYRCVFVHDTYTLQKLHTIKVPSNAMLCDIVFSQNDQLIALCCTEGVLIVYNTVTHTETMNHSSRKCVYTGCMIKSPEEVIAFGADEARRGIVRRIVKDDIVDSVQLTGARIVSGHFFSENNLAVGTENGLIKFFDYSTGSGKEYSELNLHAGPVSKMLLSPSGNLAFTCGEDGVVFVYGVKRSQLALEDEKKQDEIATTGMVEALADVVLVEKDKMRREHQGMEKLMAKVEDLDRERKLVEEHLVRQHQKQVEEMELEKRNSLAELEQRIVVLKQELGRKEMQYTETLKKQEANHMASVSDLESVFKTKLDHERKNYMNLEQSLKEEIQKLQDALQKRDEDRVKEVVQDHEKYERDLERLSKKLKEIKEAQSEVERRNGEKLGVQDEEHDKEMDLREVHLSKEINGLKETIKAKDEELNRSELKITELSKDKTDLIHKNQGLVLSHEQAQSQIIKMQVDVERAQKERMEAIEEVAGLKSSLLKVKAKYKMGVKERQTLSELSKGLRDKITPLTEENLKMKNRIREIESEYGEYITIMEQQKKATEKQASLIDQQRVALVSKGEELKKKDKDMEEVRRTIFRYKEKKNTNKRAYEEMFKEMYGKYVAGCEELFVNSPDVTNEIDKQIKYLHEKATSIEANGELKRQQLEKTCKSLRGENTRLLKELNDITERLKDSSRYQVSLESRLRVAEKKPCDKKTLSASLQFKRSPERAISDERAGPLMSPMSLPKSRMCRGDNASREHRKAVPRAGTQPEHAQDYRE